MSKRFFGCRIGPNRSRLPGAVMIAAILAVLALGTAPSGTAYAAGPFTVNTTSDSHCTGFVSQGAPGCTAATDSGGHISLRSALEEASTAGGTTTINLPAGAYNLGLGDLVAGTQANTNITVQGAGAASTTINQTTAGRMVILVNYGVHANVAFSLSGVTISGGSENENDPDGFGGNGGAILAGGSASATGNSLAVTDAVFSGNYCSPASNAGCSGGAISMTGGGNLTVTNSTFSGNTASKNRGFGSGGAIYFDNGGNGGNVSITGSTFTNNVAEGNSTTGGQGGAVRLAGAAGSTYTVNNNVFTGNAAHGTAGAGAHGGALYLSLGSLTASFNRVAGNTSGDAGGLYVANNSGSLGTATNNWWGCNGGPSAAPCDTALLGSPNQGGSMTVSPWIVLTDVASPSPIQVNQTTTLAADLLHNSNGGALTASQINVLLGLPVAWGNAVRGTLSNQQATIQSNGTATATFTASAAGAGSADAAVDRGAATGSVTVNKADTTTNITSETPDPTVAGQSYVVNFTMTSNTGSTPTAPTGTVTASDGTDSCSGTLAAGRCSITSSTAGAKTLTATYAGDNNFNGSTSAGVAHTVNKADTTTTITSDTPDPSQVGQAVAANFTVAAAAAPGAGTPSGNVTVSDGVDSCTGTVAAGTCSITLNTPGSRTLTASYAGDNNFNGSASGGEPHMVNSAPTTTSITSDTPDPSVVGQGVTVQYSVSSASGTPAGNVTVSDGTVSCTGTVAAGQCALTFTGAGAKSLTATYGGEGTFSGSASAAEAHTVNKADTTTTISADNPDPSPPNASVTVNYAVTANAPGAGAPAGNVTVSDGVDSCTATAAAGTCSITLTTSGARTLTATYAGDSSFNGSTSAGVAHQVNKVTTALLYNGGQIANTGGSFRPMALLSSAFAACAAGQPIVFTLDRNPTTGVAGSYALGTATSNSSGRATLAAVGTPGWQEGVYTIFAAYAGTAACAASADAAALPVAAPGDSAEGGGWYTLSGSGRVNFGFTVRKVYSTCTRRCAYEGQLLLINNGKWRLKGTLGAYVKLKRGQAAARGLGDLYWWNASLNGGLGDWQLAQPGVSFTANFYACGQHGKTSSDRFGISIAYAPVAPQPGRLPNSSPQLLKGGNITVN